MKRLLIAVMSAAVLVPSAATASTIGFEVKGGVGIGYYSMSEFVDNIQLVRETFGLEFDDPASEFNVMLEGRIWMFGRFAATTGYEHLWADYNMPVGSGSYVSYAMPADILSLGGTVHIYRIPKVIDFNAGLEGLFGKVTLGTDQPGRYTEYKSNGYGWDLYGEINSNFLNPVQVGFTLGYRHLKVEDFEDKFGDIAEFMLSGDPFVLDYSGVYFYFTAGVAIW
jgi:opacity protein-like surface antigen